DPVVEAPLEAVDDVLRVLPAESPEPRRPLVRLPVAVRVLQEQHLIGAGHEDAAVRAEETRRKRDLLREDRRLLVPPVAVDLLEQPGRARRRSARIVAHLRRVEAAAL